VCRLPHAKAITGQIMLYLENFNKAAKCVQNRGPLSGGFIPLRYLVVWIIALYDCREETIVNEELIQEEKKERKKQWMKSERKRRKEHKRKERNRLLRQSKKDKEVAYYAEEFECYYEERAALEGQYDDEQCDIYHRSYIEETLNDIRKRLYQRSQPARTARHSRWETEMVLRRVQKEEQAKETEVIIYETEQQQGHNIKNDKKSYAVCPTGIAR
jgi:hypothetical protein